MNRYLPVFLIVCIIANTLLAMFFKLYQERQYSLRLADALSNVHTQVETMRTNVYARIDAYFNAHPPPSLESSSRPPQQKNNESSDPKNPRFIDIGTWDYHFFTVNNSPCAKSGISYYFVGDVCPYGGVITSINSDCVVVDGRFYYRNPKSQAAYNFNWSSNNVARLDTSY